MHVIAFGLQARGGATVERLQGSLLGTLPRIIAVNWEPEGGKNQLDAAVTNVLARLKTQHGRTTLKRAASTRAAPAPRTARSAANGLTHAQVAPNQHAGVAAPDVPAKSPVAAAAGPSTAAADEGARSRAAYPVAPAAEEPKKDVVTAAPKQEELEVRRRAPLDSSPRHIIT